MNAFYFKVSTLTGDVYTLSKDVAHICVVSVCMTESLSLRIGPLSRHLHSGLDFDYFPVYLVWDLPLNIWLTLNLRFWDFLFSTESASQAAPLSPLAPQSAFRPCDEIAEVNLKEERFTTPPHTHCQLACCSGAGSRLREHGGGGSILGTKLLTL